MAEILQSRAKRSVRPEALLDTVAHYFDIESSLLSGPRGKKDVARARHVAMYLLKKSSCELGKLAWRWRRETEGPLYSQTVRVVHAYGGLIHRNL